METISRQDKAWYGPLNQHCIRKKWINYHKTNGIRKNTGYRKHMTYTAIYAEEKICRKPNSQHQKETDT